MKFYAQIFNGNLTEELDEKTWFPTLRQIFIFISPKPNTTAKMSDDVEAKEEARLLRTMTANKPKTGLPQKQQTTPPWKRKQREQEQRAKEAAASASAKSDEERLAYEKQMEAIRSGTPQAAPEPTETEPAEETTPTSTTTTTTSSAGVDEEKGNFAWLNHEDEMAKKEEERLMRMMSRKK